MGMTAFTPPAVLTIDAGSGSCRALVFDAAGSLRGMAQREWTYRPVPGAPGGSISTPATVGGRYPPACAKR